MITELSQAARGVKAKQAGQPEDGEMASIYWRNGWAWAKLNDKAARSDDLACPSVIYTFAEIWEGASATR